MNPGYILIVLGIYVLGCASVTRLINADEILNPLRARIASREFTARDAATEAARKDQPVIAGQHTRRADRWATAFKFVGCPWCVSFWVALPAAVPVVQVLGWSYWAILPLAFAARYVIGRTAPDEEIESERK